MKSVISFYEIDEKDALSDVWDEVWQKHVIDKANNGERVRCTNVWHYDDISPLDLAAIVRHHRLTKDELDGIRREHRNGATMMWVMPVQGNPLYGVFIAEILVVAAKRLLDNLSNNE